MRKLPIRATALVLAVLLTLGPAASASWAMGTKTHHGTTRLAEGVDYTRRYLWSDTYSDLRTERYMEYTPNTTVQPMVAYGDYVLSKNTLSALADRLETEGKRVIGGINGDFFVVATGAPVGMVVTDGILRSSSSYTYALGFFEDGTAFIGKPELSVTATFGGQTLSVSGGLNKVRSDTGGYVLYTDDYFSNTQHSGPGIDVVLSPGGEEATIGAHISCTVEQVLQSTGSIPIPEGKWILSINNSANQWLVNKLSALQAGETVEIDITCADTRWENAVTALGGLYKMVTGGAVEPGLENTQSPRTAVGIRADGSTVFYTVDGRQTGYSVGASMKQVALRLVELGCVEAICLDGGGSTTLGATRPGGEEFEVLNSPSDGRERAVSNALFLVAEQVEPSPAQQLVTLPGDAVVLSGSKLPLSVFSTDVLGRTVDTLTTDQVSWSVPEGAGAVTNGILTAGNRAGTYTLEVSAGDLTGSTCITVVPTPDRITLQDEATGITLSTIHLDPGETLRLGVAALYRNLPVLCRDESFTWSISEGLGTIDRSGNFTARDMTGTGTITAALGEKSVTIPVTVAGTIRTAEDFEGSFQTLTGSSAAQMEPETTWSHVRFGAQSARLSYDTAGEDAVVPLPLELEGTDRYLTLWVCGDGSGNTLTAPVQLANGSNTDLTLARLDFTGWQQFTVHLPTNTAAISSLKITPTGTQTSGTIWLDQITLSNQFLTDSDAPILSASWLGTTLQANIQDNMDETFDPARITVTYDGRPIPFTLDGAFLTAAFPEDDGLAHRLTVTAADSSGNVGRTTVEILPSAEREHPFADAENHWARDFITYLYDQGIINGTVSEGNVLYLPGSNITRGEFAVMVARWLRLDLTQYEDLDLPFVDADTIPDWMLPAVKAMYALGYMQGSSGADGLYANAMNTITRAEAITLLARTQPRGGPQAELTFEDTAEIPQWAAEAVSTLVAQGVVGGSNNRFLPNHSITRGEMAKILSVLW